MRKQITEIKPVELEWNKIKSIIELQDDEVLRKGEKNNNRKKKKNKERKKKR